MLVTSRPGETGRLRIRMNGNTNEVRTRYAPSPTGYMHVGNLRTAVFEYLIAKVNKGKFIFRLEDTDQKRYVEGAVEVIYKTLETVGITYDEGPEKGGRYGPYIQSERKDIYVKYAKELVDKGFAYYCFCSRERLAALVDMKYDRRCVDLSEEEIKKNLDMGMPYVIRQKMPVSGTTSFVDVIYGEITFDNKELEDQILIKSDGYPTYNFANVIDDHLMKITHVVRGNEYITSTPKYNLLYDFFGWERPEYVHVPLIIGEDGKKLSKRNGDCSFEDLVQEGFLPEAIVNYIALLGWNPGNEREFFTMKELEEVFDYRHISKSPALFDKNKLRWMNGEYIRKMTFEEFFDVSRRYIEQEIENPDIDLEKVAKILMQRTEVLTEIPEKIGFFEKLPEYDIDIYIHKKMKTDPDISYDSLLAAEKVFEDMEDWDNDSIYEALVGKAAAIGIKNSQILWPVRTALTGLPVSPGGASEVAEILGKQESIKRIQKGIGKLKK